ncbi:hypothetical protein BHE74_00050000 [Ensete ventricosum]|nr:hypothetical protein BHE74_00050000 [Ensete ventricosum]
MGRGQRISATRERALGPTSGWWAMKRRRAIAVLQEGNGSSGWKSRRKHRRLEERAAAVVDEGYDCGCNFSGGGNEGSNRHGGWQGLGAEGRCSRGQ